MSDTTKSSGSAGLLTIPESKLVALSQLVLEAYGCSANEASIVAAHLVGANLAGHDSHGVGMLPAYGAQVRDGNLIPNQTLSVVSQHGGVTILDGRRGFGHRMALEALDTVLDSVSTHGVVVMGLRNAGHISRTGHYAEYCAARGLVSLHFVNVIGHSPLVTPFGGRQPVFSTNPISMAMPVAGEAKPMLDMATSEIAFGKVRVAHNKGTTVPDGCLVDAEGRPTNDPTPMATELQGALTAFGAHKGSGLGIFAELLAGALVSGDTVASVPPLANGAVNSLFSVILDPAAFGDPAQIERETEQFCGAVTQAQPALDQQEVLLPGEPEHRSRQARGAHGIPVDPVTLAHILDTARTFGVTDSDIDQWNAL